ncbi:MAG: DUF5666 domain-containing protein [Candidatus Omnitrophota bacterium]|nr:DUF5666 domain-containing protein [Candidatus Omnitrophota bacterium]
MLHKLYSFVILGTVCIALLAVYAFSQDVPSVNKETPASTSISEPTPSSTPSSGNISQMPTPTVSSESTPLKEAKPITEEARWVWAEVISVDTANNQALVKYLDYDTDEEKELTIVIDDNTRFENAEGIKAIAVGDNVGVDYVLNDKGQAVAKSIALEKAEAMPKPATEETIELTPQKESIAPQETTNAVEVPATK